MRPRAGTLPVTLEPRLVVEVLSLARQHDEMLKEARQDLFRAETKLRVERRWKWPIRLGCVALGVATVFAFQNETLMAATTDFFRSLGTTITSAGYTSLIGLVVSGVVLYAAYWLIRRAMQGPTPEQTARKLMEQFAEKDGVAAYVFAGEDTVEDEAASIGALTRPENTTFRQRRLTQSNRTLSSSLTRLLNRTGAEEQSSLLH
ncbi:MAG TPA: hypothetical protein PLN33_12090 [Hyphomonadaceae bacterium]|nr:hypothetical protein [Hyphomonadaceae bacterium]HPN07019.1 hypothetical protein [Hyphomonadaceae bacterium]